jgi:DNA invertase Pin-like site-specific DNA recombinase
VSDVGLGRAGIVMGLEVSRLARNNADWHRLLEICALADTLILDEDGVYDPASFNDRLLLGLKGTMSEAELHVIKARLRGGILNKVRRGEYRCPLPTGFVYDEVGEVAFDPDSQVRETIAYFFETFLRVGSGRADREGLSQRGTLLSISHPQSRADDLPAADDIDGDPNAEQSALRRRVRVWPAAISAGCRRKEEASDP